MSWEAIQTTKQDWLSERKVRFLYTLGAERHKDLPDVPGLTEFAGDDKARNILGLLGSGPDIGRAIVAEPGIPPERAAALRAAFMETMRDPAFIADMHARNLTIDALTGEELQRIIAKAAATPQELTAQARRYVGQ
jgi:tripartite-type tricarboxylate transporter receptor subunit TctC